MLKPFKEAGAEAAQQNHDFWKATCRSYEVSINMYAMKTSLLLKKSSTLTSPGRQAAPHTQEGINVA